MYRPRLSAFIDELQRLAEVHGDLEVVAYSDQHNEEYPDIEPQVDSTHPVVLLVVETEGL